MAKYEVSESGHALLLSDEHHGLDADVGKIDIGADVEELTVPYRSIMLLIQLHMAFSDRSRLCGQNSADWLPHTDTHTITLCTPPLSTSQNCQCRSHVSDVNEAVHDSPKY